MINNDSNVNGIYRAVIINRGTLKVYIPSIATFKLFENNSLTIIEEVYEKCKDTLPSARWCVPCMEAMVCDEIHQCWVVFECGDYKRPIIMGFVGKGIKYHAINSNDSDGNDINNPNNFVLGDISGVTKNIKFTGHGTITPTYLILHTIAGPNESADSIINDLANKGLGIHGIITNTGVIQTAEWNTKQYHAGDGANTVGIGLEMLECKNITWDRTTWVPSWSDDSRVKSYHDAVYSNAVNIYAALANMFNIPTSNIISHREAHFTLGATNHGDPECLWNYFNKKWGDSKWTMDGFRANVDKVRQTLEFRTTPTNLTYTGGSNSDWLNTVAGTSAKEHGPGTGTQCVELANAYLDSMGIKNYGGYGNGNTYYSGVANAHPDKFSKITYTSGTTIMPGDIISLRGSQTQYGHVAIVKSVNGNNITIVEQWNGSGTVRESTFNVNDGGKRTILGIARPK